MSIDAAIMAAVCPFCERIRNGQYEVTHIGEIVKFEPLNPVTPGHMLYVPVMHVKSARMSPEQTGLAMEAAAWDLNQDGGEANLITSSGRLATQTVKHLHVHFVPRRENDGLALPWTGQAPLRD